MDLEHATQRVVGAGTGALQLLADLGANRRENDQAVDREQEGEHTNRGDRVAHVATLVPALFQGRAVNDSRQERTTGGAGRVDTELVHAFRGIGQLFGPGRVVARGLTRQHTQGVIVVGQVVAIGVDHVEGADTDDLTVLALAGGGGNFGVKPDYLAGLGDLAQHLVPDALDFLDLRQLVRGAHLVDQLPQELAAVRILGGDQGDFQVLGKVAGCRGQVAEQFGQGTQTLFQLLLFRIHFQLVLLELAFEACRTGFLAVALLAGLLQHVLLFSLGSLEAALTLAVFLGFAGLALLHELQQLV